MSTVGVLLAARPGTAGPARPDRPTTFPIVFRSASYRSPVKGQLGNGFELDDDRARIDAVVAVLALVTVIGAPLGFAILLGLWPLAGFVGYVVTGIWIGDWVLHRSVGAPARRPYVEAVLGVLVLAVLSAIPVLGFLTAIASLFGFGAVLLLVWRILRGTSAIRAPAEGSPQPPTTTPAAPV